MFKNKKWTLIVLVGALALALGGMAFGLVSTANAAGLTESGLFHGRGPGGVRPGEMAPAGNEYLAEALGISTEDLQAAYQAAQAAGLEQAVEAGLITQAQADLLAERGFSARHGFRMPGNEIDPEALLAEALGISVDELQAAQDTAQAARLVQAIAAGELTEDEAALIEARQALRNYLEKDEIVATALGISIEQLQAAQDEGLRIPALLEELGLTQDEFQANLQTVHTEMLQQAVADDVITQEQADLLSASDFGEHGGPGGHKRPGRGAFPGGMQDFDGRRCFPGRSLPGGMDGTNFQLPETPLNEE